MTTLIELRTAVSNLLSEAGASGALQLNSDTRERAFEAYVFSLVVRAARRAGATVDVRGIVSGPNPDPLVFRGAPGRLGSAGQDFAYASCLLNGWAFEIHVDVEYEGSSKAVHEIDISIVEASHATEVRADPNQLARTRHVTGVFECKFYDSSLGVSLGRTLVGLVDDCGNLRAKALLTNGSHVGLARYLQQARRPEPFFELSPTAPETRDRFVSFLEQVLRKCASVA